MTPECRIVICHRRWVFIGFLAREENEMVLRRAKVLRRWGTKDKGIGALYSGPLADTQMDEAGTVRLHPLQIIATVDVDAKSWEKHLK
jgi:hypothetical protein